MRQGSARRSEGTARAGPERVYLYEKGSVFRKLPAGTIGVRSVPGGEPFLCYGKPEKNARARTTW